MAERIAIVTGSNKGIGYGIVKNLCEKFTGTVYLTSRDPERGNEAVKKLNEIGLHPKYHQLDIDDEESIKKFANFIQETHGGIDVLVNNAAIAFKATSDVPFEAQAEDTIRVNFYGTLKLCKALFPLLRPHARVVNLSSSLGYLLKIPGESLRKKFSDDNLTLEGLSALMCDFVSAAKRGDHESLGWPNSCYVVSKVGIAALTRVQQRQMNKDKREDIVINCVHPGYVITDMTGRRGALTVEQGAVAPTYLALLPPNVTSPKGDYVWHNSEITDWVNGPTPTEY